MESRLRDSIRQRAIFFSLSFALGLLSTQAQPLSGTTSGGFPAVRGTNPDSNLGYAGQFINLNPEQSTAVYIYNRSAGSGVYSVSAGLSGFSKGIYGESMSVTGTGIFGLASSTTGLNYGIYGQSNSPTGFAGYFMGRGYFSGNTGFGTSVPLYPVDARGENSAIRAIMIGTSGGPAISGIASATTGTGAGIQGSSNAPSGMGVRGIATHNSGINVGVYGETSSSAGFGGYFIGRGYFSGQVGIGTSTPTAALDARGGNSLAINGVTEGSGATGIFGWSQSTAGFGVGVTGRSNSTNGTGLYGIASATSGTNYGVYALSNSTSGYAGYFIGRGYFSGNVGLGVLTPSARLHVGGNAIISSNLTVAGDIVSTVGGDLSGSLPSPTVAKIQGRSLSSAAPSTGQVLKWNGSAWAPADDTNSNYSAGSGLHLDESVFSIANGGVTTAMIANLAVTNDKIADGAVTTAIIANGAVSSVKLADEAVTEDKIVNGAVTTNKLDNGAVKASKIHTNAVETDKIADGAVTTAKLADDSITNAKVANGALSPAKLSTTGAQAGNSLIYSGNGIAWGTPYAYISLPFSGYENTNSDYSLQVIKVDSDSDKYAISGININGIGLFGASGDAQGRAIYGFHTTGGTAGYFSGAVEVTGSLSKGGGSFKIDHPLDPANKFLYHSFVESPDMMNVYNGNVVTDAQGYATITMPEWFETLNRDFRYQLTVLDEDDSDEFILVKVTREMRENHFTIRSSKPFAKVSWQVTGIRHDPWANKYRIPVEQWKNDRERGKYQHPDLYGQPQETGVGYIPVDTRSAPK